MKISDREYNNIVKEIYKDAMHQFQYAPMDESLKDKIKPFVKKQLKDRFGLIGEVEVNFNNDTVNLEISITNNDHYILEESSEEN